MSSAHSTAFEWWPVRFYNRIEPDIEASTRAIEFTSPVLNPLLYRHASAVLGIPRETLGDLADGAIAIVGQGGDTELSFASVAELSSEGAVPYARTGGIAIASLLDATDLEARRAELAAKGESEELRIVAGLLARDCEPSALLITGFEQAPDDIMVQLVAGAGRTLHCSAAFEEVVECARRIANLARFAAADPLMQSILIVQAASLNEAVVDLVVDAVRGLARACPTHDDEIAACDGKPWRERLLAAEIVLARALHVASVRAAGGGVSVPQPFAPTVAVEAFLRLCELVANRSRG